MSQWVRWGALVGALACMLVGTAALAWPSAKATDHKVPQYRTQDGAESRWQESKPNHWKQMALKR